MLLLCAWWAVPSAVKGLVRNAFYEAQAPAWSALSYLGDLQSFWTDRTRTRANLIEAGRDLARLNSAYLLRLQEAGARDDELMRIESMLALPALPEWRYVVARVVRRDLDTWWQQIVIRRGASDGLQVGDGVVYRDGVVGRVVEVHAYTSVVELVSSASFRVAAHVEGDLRPVTYVGTPAPVFRDPGGEATNLPADIITDPNQPRRLVTSRLGGAFPDGLTIGFLRRMEPEPDGLFQRSDVLLNPGLVGIQEVAVLVPILREVAPVQGGASAR
ncbi:MAG: rod shape-determining protein MreC [Opitutales bacterium]